MKSTIAFLVKKMAVAIDSTIKFTSKSHYGGPEFLVYVVSNHKEPLQELTGSKTLTRGI